MSVTYWRMPAAFEMTAPVYPAPSPPREPMFSGSAAFQIVPPDDEVITDVKDENVDWLLADGDDSAVLDPGVSTMMFDVSQINTGDAADDDPAAEKKKGSKGLSAGKYFKDYLGS